MRDQQGVETALDIRTAREAAEGSAGVEAQLQSVRELSATSEKFTADTRAHRLSASGDAGDEWLETDTGLLYYATGTGWKYKAGIAFGTNAAMAALSISANDNGAWFFVTDAGLNYGWWRVVGGVFAHEMLPTTIDVLTAIKINGNQVIGARKTGWTLPTSTKTRSNADYSTLTLAQLAEVVAALVNDLHSSGGGTHGLLTT